MRRIEMTTTGGPEVLELVSAPEPHPKQGEVLVEVIAAGVNFIDTYHRSGLYPVDLPFAPGLEGCGKIVGLGDSCERFALGDTVAWTTSAGSYAELKLVEEKDAVAVPADVGPEIAAAAMLQGLTAHYLATDTAELVAGQRCLIHAGAGGVGLLLIQIAKLRGAEVFTTVGTQHKAELAVSAGADHVINYRQQDFAAAVVDIAGEQPLDVVFDGVGASVFDDSLTLLSPRGMMVTFGNASGPVPPKSPLELSGGRSLFITRPSLFNYIASRDEFERRAADLFGWIADGSLSVRIGLELDVADAAEAHRRLEARSTTGKVLLRT